MKSRTFSSILQIILTQHKSKENRLLLILVGGLSRSGKSTFSNKLQYKILENGIDSKVICLDNWIVDIAKRTGQETVRERFNYEAIIKSISEYIEGKEITTSKYDPEFRKSLNVLYKIEPISKGIVIVEGVVAIDIPELRRLSDLIVYVKTSESEREQRFHEFHLNVKKMSRQQSDLIYEQRQDNENLIIKETLLLSDIVYDN